MFHKLFINEIIVQAIMLVMHGNYARAGDGTMRRFINGFINVIILLLDVHMLLTNAKAAKVERNFLNSP